MNKRVLSALAIAVCAAFLATPGWSAYLYGNNAGFGPDHIIVMDPLTGAVADQFTTINGNGRGVVVVGNTLYYTLANSGSVYAYDLNTHTDQGVQFSVAGASGLSTMAFDGTNFWIGDYSGTNHAFLYTPGGNLLKTVTLQNCTGYCDGLEYFLQGGQGRLISNRGDPTGPYDIYDTNGNLLTPSFIAPTTNAAGIAFDGTNFYVSEIYGGAIQVYDSTGAFVRRMPITGSSPNPLVEDLSVDYSIVLPPPPSGVPEPASVVLVGSSFVGLLFWRRRNRRS